MEPVVVLFRERSEYRVRIATPQRFSLYLQEDLFLSSSSGAIPLLVSKTDEVRNREPSGTTYWDVTTNGL